jgi:preprotein translocase subunit YajC
MPGPTPQDNAAHGGALIVVPAQAAAAEGAPGQPGFLDTLPMLVAIFAIFYFFLIRPQNKARDEHQKLLGSLKKGDEVVTEGGIIGTIFEVHDDRVVLEVAREIRLAVLKTSIQRREGAETKE